MAEYIHEFDENETDRLNKQAELLEPHLHKHVDFKSCQNVLEIGCGVGAQMRILLRRFPHLNITGVDIQKQQIERARLSLAEFSGRQIRFEVGDGKRLPFADSSFDGIYICFVLEHVQDPSTVLAEAKRVVRDGGPIYCTEVFNDALFVNPHSPTIMQYWTAFNDCQREIGGDPNIGMKLCNLMLDVGLHIEWLT